MRTHDPRLAKMVVVYRGVQSARVWSRLNALGRDVLFSTINMTIVSIALTLCDLCCQPYNNAIPLNDALFPSLHSQYNNSQSHSICTILNTILSLSLLSASWNLRRHTLKSYRQSNRNKSWLLALDLMVVDDRNNTPEFALSASKAGGDRLIYFAKTSQRYKKH